MTRRLLRSRLATKYAPTKNRSGDDESDTGLLFEHWLRSPLQESDLRAPVDVWENYGDESYRRDQSHWRDSSSRWEADRWENVGRKTLSEIQKVYSFLGRDFHAECALEWGPGGGTNLLAIRSRVNQVYGVDISQKNLEESKRVLTEVSFADFSPIRLQGDPVTVKHLFETSPDLIFSKAVFQHFPSKHYTAHVLAVLREICAVNAVGYIQFRYDDGRKKYRPKDSDYASNHITMTSFPIAEFWGLLAHVGFNPQYVTILNTRTNYAAVSFTS